MSTCWLSVITILEIKTGMLQVQSKDPGFAARLKVWLETFVMKRFRYRILDIDTKVVQSAAVYRAKKNLDVADALIAATAETHGLTLVTRNVSDFEETELELLNPWKTTEK